MHLSVRDLSGNVVYQLDTREHSPLTIGDLRQTLSGVCNAHHATLSLMTKRGNEVGFEYDADVLEYDALESFD